MKFSLPIVVAIALALVPAAALAQWCDNFDTYPVGPLNLGGWAGWDGNPGAVGYVVNSRFRSAPNSAEIRPTSDAVQPFTGVNSGQWVVSGWCYIPAGIAGNQYLILMNTYTAGNPHANNHWSAQILLDMTLNQVRDADNPSSPTFPIVRGQWVEVRDEIDFASDLQSVYYGNVLIWQESWTAGTAPGGALNLALIDLYSEGAPSIYWDDLCVRRAGATPVEPTSWGQIKANFR
jgi:hypothetical protein